MTKHLAKDQRRSELLNAAVSCFAEQGYHETTMDDVVRAAGVSKGSLYWHFKSKRDLFLCLIELWFGELGQFLDGVIEQDLPAGERLRLIGETVENSVLARPDLARAFIEFGSLAMRDTALKFWFADVYKTNLGMIRRLIEEGIAQGEFRAVDPGVLAQLIVAMFDGTFMQRELVREDPAAALRLRDLIEALLGLLRP